jgi:hypothetical protein
VSALRQFSHYLVQPSLPLYWRVPTGTTHPEKQPVGPQKLINRFGSFAVAYCSESNQARARSEGTRGLESAYVIENRPSVAEFILRNRLRGLLLEAVAPLNATFGNDAIKVLNIVKDDEGSESLYCLIVTPGDMVDARQHLRAFDEEWWIDHSAKGAGRLNFDIELI